VLSSAALNALLDAWVVKHLTSAVAHLAMMGITGVLIQILTSPHALLVPRIAKHAQISNLAQNVSPVSD
jgi:hypothetical protein